MYLEDSNVLRDATPDFLPNSYIHTHIYIYIWTKPYRQNNFCIDFFTLIISIVNGNKNEKNHKTEFACLCFGSYIRLKRDHNLRTRDQSITATKITYYFYKVYYGNV